MQETKKTNRNQKLYCTYCKKAVETVVWRYVEPVDDYAVWNEQTGTYEYSDSTDKGYLECVTLCKDCGIQLKPSVL